MLALYLPQLPFHSANVRSLYGHIIGVYFQADIGLEPCCMFGAYRFIPWAERLRMSTPHA